MRRLAVAVACAFALIAQASAFADESASDRKVTTIGPISLGEARATVEKTLGASATVCKHEDTDTKVCYTDGTSLLILDYADSSAAHELFGISLQQRAGSNAALPAKRVSAHFSAWTWLGDPVFKDALPSVPDGWTMNGTGKKHLDFGHGAYGAGKGYDAKNGWTVSAGEE